MIKFHRIDRLYEIHRKPIQDLMDKTYSSGQVLQGKAVQRLEERIASMCDRKYAIAVGSCTDAISLSLMALKVNKYDTVLVNDFTFDAPKTCILRMGAYPIKCPMENEYFQMNLDKFTEVIRAEMRAIIAVNLFGQIQDMDRIIEASNNNGVPIIEDAAQSFTSQWCGRPAGSFGDISCISFDPTKIIPAFSTGGMALTDNKSLASDIRYFHYKNYGCNSQLSTFQAELILYWLDFYKEWEVRRREISLKYHVGLTIPGIQLPKTHPFSLHIWHKFVIKAERRDELKLFLANNGIETKVHYYPHPEVLSLPIYPTLEDNEIIKVIECIRRFYL